jgi:hypothetical protein
MDNFKATLYLEYWKRRNSELVTEWDVADFVQQVSEGSILFVLNTIDRNVFVLLFMGSKDMELILMVILFHWIQMKVRIMALFS